MKKLLEYKGYLASVSTSIEDECLYGKIEFIKDSIVFGADSVKELKQQFHVEVDDYIEFCAEVGKEPNKTFTGSFNVRIGAELHKKCLIRSKQDDVTMNEVIKSAVCQYVNQNEVHNHNHNHNHVQDGYYGDDFVREVTTPMVINMSQFRSVQ
ncbi:MAG: putative HicB family RNase H-like nuclease [Alteromonadaceae bacterium]|jgi:predicted HicB family RNase H-like nuclease